MSSPQIVLLVLITVAAIWAAGIAVFSVIARRRHPAIGKFIECDGVRLHYLEHGNRHGPVLVLLHGNGMLLQDFAISGVLEAADGRYRVLCFDRPGFGHSTRPRRQIWTPEAQAQLFAAALHQLDVHRAVVVGHSWGALVALAFGLRFPDLVRGLVLASGYYFPTRRKDVGLLSGPAVPVLGDLLLYTIAPLLSWLMMPKLIRTLFAPNPVSHRFSREFPLSLSLRPPHLRAGAEETALMIPAAARLQHLYAELTRPVAVITGTEDRVVDSSQTALLHKMLPRSVVRSVPAAGHMVHHAAPDRLIDAAALMCAWPQVREPEAIE